MTTETVYHPFRRKMTKQLTSHELANLLLKNPDLPIFFDGDWADFPVRNIQVGTAYNHNDEKIHSVIINPVFDRTK
jgi:hypothetical protein